MAPRAQQPTGITAETMSKGIAFMLVINLGMVGWWFNSTNGKLDKLSGDFSQAREESKTVASQVIDLRTRADKLEATIDRKSAQRDTQIDSIKDQLAALKSTRR